MRSIRRARHTCWAAEKVAAAIARWAVAAVHPPASQRPPLDRSHRMGTVEKGRPRSEMSQCEVRVQAWRMAKARTFSR